MADSRRVVPRKALLAIVVAFTAGAMGWTAVHAADQAAPAQAQAAGRVDVLILFRSAPNADDDTAVRGMGGRIRHTYSIVPAIAVNLPQAAVAALQNNPRVAIVEPDAEVFAIGSGADPDYAGELANTWGVSRIGAGSAHDVGRFGAGVKVAVIDTGIVYTHPDLAANYAGGWDFVNNDADPFDDHGHGTHVAGTISALRDGVGVVGVAPEARLYALKVLGANGSGSTSNIIAAVQWAAANGMQVTNNSYGSTAPSATADLAFANAAAGGIVHVAAAMNNGNCEGTGSNFGYPAGYRSVMAVAATDSTDARACFSSTGSVLEIAAPGVQINSTIKTGLYGSKWNGTSMASPHVAGTAALLMNVGVYDANANGRIHDEVRNLLAGTAIDLGATGRDPLFGFGLVSIPAALAAVPAAAPLTVTVDSIAYVVTGKGNAKDLNVTVGTVYGAVSPAGGADVAVTLLRNGAYYGAASGVTDINGLVTFTFKKIPAGTYTSIVTGVSASGLTWDSVTPANSVVR